jgi:hypothetical protein
MRPTLSQPEEPCILRLGALLGVLGGFAVAAHAAFAAAEAAPISWADGLYFIVLGGAIGLALAALRVLALGGATGLVKPALTPRRQAAEQDRSGAGDDNRDKISFARAHD